MMKELSIGLEIPEKPKLPDKFTREDLNRGYSSSPMYSNTWDTPEDRMTVRRRKWRKEEEDNE